MSERSIIAITLSDSAGAPVFYDRRVVTEELWGRLVDDQAASDQPYSELARRAGLLTVYGTLGTFYCLARSGDVLLDSDEGVLRPAGSGDREIAYVQAARRFPRLGYLMPVRPQSAWTCDRCGGSGAVAIDRAGSPVCCPDCNTRGWTVAL